MASQQQEIGSFGTRAVTESTMYQIDLKEAESRLPELIEEAARGGEVVITRGDGAAFRLVPVKGPRPKFGSARGLVEMSEDFDEPVEGFEEYAP